VPLAPEVRFFCAQDHVLEIPGPLHAFMTLLYNYRKRGIRGSLPEEVYLFVGEAVGFVYEVGEPAFEARSLAPGSAVSA
jgi:hypothetical protein